MLEKHIFPQTQKVQKKTISPCHVRMRYHTRWSIRLEGGQVHEKRKITTARGWHINRGLNVTHAHATHERIDTLIS
ncbi:MAG: hypothetical protein CMH81_01965 [Nitrospiraceae bacterium]|nr:hypothetical protein [Nitrospiraceae bacterium]